MHVRLSTFDQLQLHILDIAFQVVYCHSELLFYIVGGAIEMLHL